MTNAEAIEMLNKWSVLLPSDADEALDMAIEALKNANKCVETQIDLINRPFRETITPIDLISRQAAIDEIRKCRFVVDAIEKIRGLPSAKVED